MPRVAPVTLEAATPEQKAIWSETVAAHGVVTNMKATLLHSPVALKAVLEWYALFDRVKPFLGEREAVLFLQRDLARQPLRTVFPFHAPCDRRLG